MGCCNKAPAGGTRSLGPLFKLVGLLFAVIFILALFAN